MDKQLSLLLAEDDLISRRLIRILIEKLGHQVNVVENGKKAFDAFKKDHYDIILMDIQMPLMDGLECTKKIREYEQENNRTHVTIIAVTAHAMIGDKEKCLNAGMDDYITKPIEERVLLSKINKFKMNQGQELKVANIKKLRKLLENTSDVQEIVSDFLEYYPHQLHLIKEKANQNAFNDMGNLVHKLKGSVSNFEAEKVVEVLRELEMCAKENNKMCVDGYLIKLETELETLKSYLLKNLS